MKPFMYFLIAYSSSIHVLPSSYLLAPCLNTLDSAALGLLYAELYVDSK